MSRRIRVDLSEETACDVDKMKQSTGLTTAEVFRHAIGIFRACVLAQKEGKEIFLVNSVDQTRIARLEIPLSSGV